MSRLRKHRVIQLLVTALAMGQLLAAQVMVANAGLHKLCHDHADDPAHQCAVTLILGDGCQSELPDVLPVDVVPERPLADVAEPGFFIAMPCQMMGGIMAHAPPRGP